MEKEVVITFKKWVRINVRHRKPTGQDVAFFCAQIQVRREFPYQFGYPKVWSILKAAKAFDA